MTEREAWEILGERYRNKTNRHAGICLEAWCIPDEIGKLIEEKIEETPSSCNPLSSAFRIGYKWPIHDTESRAAFCFAQAEKLKQQGL